MIMQAPTAMLQNSNAIVVYINRKEGGIDHEYR